MSFSDLETERLLLRPLGYEDAGRPTAEDAGRAAPEDAAALYAIRSDPVVARYQGWVPGSLEEAEVFLQGQAGIEPDTPGTWFQLGIFLRETGELIGDCGMRFPAKESAEVEFGVSLAPVHQGKGLASEALTALFDYIFGTLGKHRIIGSVDPANEASIRLMERLGMRREAHFCENIIFKGVWADEMIYAVLDREWQARRG